MYHGTLDWGNGKLSSAENAESAWEEPWHTGGLVIIAFHVSIDFRVLHAA